MVYPFHSESERDYHAWIGLYIHTWRATERGLDMLVRVLYEHFDGASLEPKAPLALNRKLKFVRRAVSRSDNLKHESEEVEALTGFLKTESKFRHDVIHGSSTKFLKSDPHYDVVERALNRNDPFGSASQVVITEQELRSRYDKLGYASMSLLGLTFRLIAIAKVGISDLENRINDLEIKKSDLEHSAGFKETPP